MVRGRRAAAAPTIAAAAAATSHVDDVSAPPDLGPPPPVGRFEMVPLARIRRAPWNPRKLFDEEELRKLAASIRVHNIGEPLLVRTIDGTDALELVAGERRERAAEMAGLLEVPVVIRDLTDEQAFDLACIENGQRVDLHPLEEADAFAVKRDRFHRTVEQIAAQVGQKAGYVKQRLKLADLCEPGRKALFAEKISLSTALRIARMPNAKDQVEASKGLSNWRGGEVASYNEARHYLQQHFMLDLARATFPVADAELVPAAGPCTTCPKRTGNQQELFADVASADTCTDRKCFDAKVEAAWKRESDKARESGIKVLSASESKAIWSDQWSVGDFRKLGFTDLNSTCSEDGNRRSYKQLLKDKPPVAIARNPHNGTVVELVETKGIARLLKEAGHDFSKKKKGGRSSAGTSSSTSGHAAWQKKQEAERKARELRKRIAETAIAELLPKIEKGEAHKKYYQLLVEAELVGNNLYRYTSTLKRRNVKQNKLKPFIAGLSEDQLRAMLVDLAIGDGVGHNGAFAAPLVAACSLYGVDLKKLETAEKAKEKQPETKGAAKGKPAAAKKATPRGRGSKRAAAKEADAGDDSDDDGEPKPGRCRICRCTERDACAPMGCAWANAEQTLCTLCVGHESETRDETWRRVLKQGHSVFVIARRWGVPVPEVDALLFPQAAAPTSGPLSIVCPRCQARVGQRCTNYLGKGSAPHRERVQASKKET